MADRVIRWSTWLLGLGIAATLAANVAHGSSHGLAGAAVSAWPAVALVGSYELLMMIIRNRRFRRTARPGPCATRTCCRSGRPSCSPGNWRRTEFLSVVAIRAQLHVGQLRAQRLRDYLATGTPRRKPSCVSSLQEGQSQRPRPEGRLHSPSNRPMRCCGPSVTTR